VRCIGHITSVRGTRTTNKKLWQTRPTTCTACLHQTAYLLIFIQVRTARNGLWWLGFLTRQDEYVRVDDDLFNSSQGMAAPPTPSSLPAVPDHALVLTPAVQWWYGANWLWAMAILHTASLQKNAYIGWNQRLLVLPPHARTTGVWRVNNQIYGCRSIAWN
jgi:hypothetical protein